MTSTLSASRLLLPKPTRSEPRDKPAKSVPTLTKLSSTPIACEECRAKKTKCDGLKPACSRCRARQEPCSYRPQRQTEVFKRKNDELQKSANDLHHILELLRTAPEETAQAVLTNLRGSKSVTDFLDLAGPHPLAPVTASLTKTARGTSILTAASLELDINVHVLNDFPGLIPLEITDTDLRLLGVGDLTLPSTRPPKRRRHSHQAPRYLPDDPQDKFSTLGASLRLEVPTTSLGQYADTRLNDLAIYQWTTVPVSDCFAAKAISFYLINEHPFLGLFDPVLFVGDLVSGKAQFCSHLLVSSLLAWACGAYAQFNPDLECLSTAFFEEARTRWEERTVALTTVSSAILLNLTCNYLGNDSDGVLYLEAGVDIGRSLYLFDEGDRPAPSMYSDDKDTRAAASFAAWGAFGWHTLHSVHFRREHLIRHPPSLPIPGDESDTASVAMPDYMGKTFTYITKLWLAVHEMPVFWDGYATSNVPLSTAEAAYQKLSAWSEILPDNARMVDSCPHHILVMHILYHTAIMELWRPFLTTNNHTKLEPAFIRGDNWPKAANDASVRQLKRLVYLYRKRFELTGASTLAAPGFKYLLNEVFRHYTSPESQFYFILALRGYLSQAYWSPVMRGTAKAFFSLGSRKGFIWRPDADGLVAEIQRAAGPHVKDVHYRSLYPLDLGVLVDDGKGENMEGLAEEFQQLAISYDKGSDDRRGHRAAEKQFWKGDPQDLNLTLSDAVEGENLLEWET